MGSDPHDRDRRILAQTKKNLSAPQPSLAFSIVPGESGQPTITWHGPSPLTADQLTGARSPAVEGGHARAQARELLRQFLEVRPRLSEEVWAMANECGLAERTLMRAKQELPIRCRRVYLEGRQLTYWLLPHQAIPDHIPTSAIESDPQALLQDILNREEDNRP